MKVINVSFKFYKRIISPVLKYLFGGGCRYYPTCSEYSKQAVNKYGVLKGGIISLRRVLRCNPFNNNDYYDPLPKKIRLNLNKIFQ